MEFFGSEMNAFEGIEEDVMWEILLLNSFFLLFFHKKIFFIKGQAYDRERAKREVENTFPRI